MFLSVESSIPFRVIDRSGEGRFNGEEGWESSANKGKSYSAFKVTAFSSGNSACCKKLTAGLALQHVSTTSCAREGGVCTEKEEKERGEGKKKGGQLLSLQDQLKYPDGWLESRGREYEAPQQKIK